VPFSFANVDGRACLVEDDSYFDLERISQGSISADPMQAIARNTEFHELAASLGSHESDGVVSETRLRAPVPRPRNSFGVGLNYKDHAEESKMDLPKVPVVFTKYPSCIAGPYDAVLLRGDSNDYEAELVVVIGQTTRDVAYDQAWSHVAGLTIGQDVSDRALQLAARPAHFGLGKSRDTYGPTGPVLVSPDNFDDPNDLSITCDINGERRQDARTSSLIFDVPFLVSYLSEIMTLEAGDLIFTGTPAGVGMPDKRFLKAGDVIRTTVGGIGAMENTCQ
tara:strand:+ start:2029 stop:2865 length:837 start_codon:yes stop_codon:yes gene_type:complete